MLEQSNSPRGSGRRAEYAELTRRSIVDAARELFFEQGFSGTTVEAIARRARVATATVHAVRGGKHGLLRTIIQTATTDAGVQQVYDHISAATDANTLIDDLCHETRVRFERWSGLMRVVATAAPDVPAAAQAQRMAHRSLRGALARAGARLQELGALREGLDAAAATDALWFYLSNSAYSTMTEDNGWPLDRVEAWLATTIRSTVAR